MKKICLLFCLLFVLTIPSSDAITFVQTAAGGASQCTSDAEVAPTADTTQGGGWVLSTGTDTYALLDESIATHSSATYVSQQNDTSVQADVIRYTVEGGCDIDSVSVVLYGACTGGSNIGVEISPDNSNWETQDSQAIESATDYTFAFTSLGYSVPTYIYVRFIPTGAADYNTIIAYNIAIIVNPTP